MLRASAILSLFVAGDTPLPATRAPRGAAGLPQRKTASRGMFLHQQALGQRKAHERKTQTISARLSRHLFFPSQDIDPATVGTASRAVTERRAVFSFPLEVA